jgi:hypothetical protein
MVVPRGRGRLRTSPSNFQQCLWFTWIFLATSAIGCLSWVQQQSRIAARGWILPSAIRNAALRERGVQMLRDRYRLLLISPP